MATPLCYTIIIPFFTALLLVGWIHPRLVKIALLKNIVDNPDARKLQRTPVPVLGGVAVFFGVVIAINSRPYNHHDYRLPRYAQGRRRNYSVRLRCQ